MSLKIFSQRKFLQAHFFVHFTLMDSYVKNNLCIADYITMR